MLFRSYCVSDAGLGRASFRLRSVAGVLNEYQAHAGHLGGSPGLGLGLCVVLYPRSADESAPDTYVHTHDTRCMNTVIAGKYPYSVFSIDQSSCGEEYHLTSKQGTAVCPSSPRPHVQHRGLNISNIPTRSSESDPNTQHPTPNTQHPGREKGGMGALRNS